MGTERRAERQIGTKHRIGECAGPVGNAICPDPPAGLPFGSKVTPKRDERAHGSHSIPSRLLPRRHANASAERKRQVLGLLQHDFWREDDVTETGGCILATIRASIYVKQVKGLAAVDHTLASVVSLQRSSSTIGLMLSPTPGIASTESMTMSRHPLRWWGMKPTVPDECHPTNLHALALVHRGLHAARLRLIVLGSSRRGPLPCYWFRPV